MTFLDDEYPDAIRKTPADQPVKFTLTDWDDLGGYIAAESNHTTDKRLGKRLDAIFAKVQKLLDTYTDEEPPKTVKIEEARKAEVPENKVCHRNGLPVQDHPEGHRAADLAANPDQGLHSRQAPRAHPDGDGLDELPSPPVRDWRRSLRRSRVALRGLRG